MEHHDRPAVVARLLHELPRSCEVVLHDRLGTDRRRVRAAAGKYRIASSVILRLADRPSEICHLVHHVEQRLARLLVVERRVEEVRPEPALHPEGIEEERLEIRVLFDLGDEVERRLLPPVHLTRREVFRRLPGVGDVPPDDLIEVHLLAAG